LVEFCSVNALFVQSSVLTGHMIHAYIKTSIAKISRILLNNYVYFNLTYGLNEIEYIEVNMQISVFVK